jgi:cell division protein FtsA
MAGVVEVAKKKLRLPARLGKPEGFGGIAEQASSPAFAVALGLIRWGVEQESRGGRAFRVALPDMRQTVGKVKDWFRTFLP